MASPPRPRLPLLAALLLLPASCGGHRHAAATTPPGPAGPPPVERCGPAAAAGSRCADALAALGGLAAGDRLQGGKVSEVAVERDRIVVSLTADDGRIVGVEAARPDASPGAPPPLASTPALSLFVRSEAPGVQTPAWQAALVQALADALARTARPAPAWLAPLRDPVDARPPAAP